MQANVFRSNQAGRLNTFSSCVRLRRLWAACAPTALKYIFIYNHFYTLNPTSCNMPNYKRMHRPGGMWFFTVNLLQRRHNDLLVREIELLRQSVRKVRASHPFEIVAWVVLPNHMHCIWHLPQGDSNYSTRWRLIKSHFSRSLPSTEYRSPIRQQAGERGIWQRHYWEHLIRDEEDFQWHFDYVHINPLKHGLVEQVKDWPYSTFHRYVEQGVYPQDWAGIIEEGDFGE